MTTNVFNVGDFVHHAKRGEGEIRTIYPPIKACGRSIPAYGVRFPEAQYLVICTENELHHKPTAITPATEFYKNRDPLQES
jgi:hypothetical protein